MRYLPNDFAIFVQQISSICFGMKFAEKIQSRMFDGRNRIDCTA